MKEYKLQLLILSVVGLIAIGISLTASVTSLSAAPSANPPSGNVTPTFSGLNVTGSASVGNDLSVADLLTTNRFRVNVGSTILIGDVGVFGITTFYNDINAYADINSASGNIGSFYTKIATSSISTSGPHATPTVSCYSGDWVTACDAILTSDHASDKLYGTMTEGNRTCKALAGNNGGAADSITLYARCFDPNGARTGTY